MEKYNQLVGQIYDCAANPDLWTETLVSLNSAIGSAYISVAHADLTPISFGQPPSLIYRNSPWDAAWLEKLGPLLPTIPGAEVLFQSEIDSPWTQLAQLEESEFQKSEFYQKWVKPQNLRDTLNVRYLKRQNVTGVISAPRSMGHDLYTNDEIDFVVQLSPHIRRAMVINDLVDKGRLALALYRQVLDSMATPVFIMSLGRRIVFCNASAEQILVTSKLLKSKSGVLSVVREGDSAKALEEAIDRCAKGHVNCGTSGIGVPLVDDEGDRAAAYVLPIGGSDLRGDLGKGFAAVFVSKRSEQQPMAIEILRTIFDLTPAEARVSTLIAKGDDPAAISDALNISVNTVRTHLAHVFQKTGARDQLALSTVVNQLLPPIT